MQIFRKSMKFVLGDIVDISFLVDRDVAGGIGGSQVVFEGRDFDFLGGRGVREGYVREGFRGVGRGRASRGWCLFDHLS